jgi:hypothetical protein
VNNAGIWISWFFSRPTYCIFQSAKHTIFLENATLNLCATSSVNEPPLPLLLLIRPPPLLLLSLYLFICWAVKSGEAAHRHWLYCCVYKLPKIVAGYPSNTEKTQWYIGLSNNNTKFNKQHNKIWGFHGGDYDDYHLLGDDNHQHNKSYTKYTKEKKYIIKAPAGSRTQTVICTAITCRPQPRQRIT